MWLVYLVKGYGLIIVLAGFQLFTGGEIGPSAITLATGSIIAAIRQDTILGWKEKVSEKRKETKERETNNTYYRYQAQSLAKEMYLEDLAKLSLEERRYVEQRVENKSKDKVIAWVLWFFLGMFGVHRFYFGKNRSANGMLLTTVFTFGFVTFIWLIVDAFKINEWLLKDEETIRENTIKDVLMIRKK